MWEADREIEDVVRCRWKVVAELQHGGSVELASQDEKDRFCHVEGHGDALRVFTDIAQLGAQSCREAQGVS
jgi:hypothetical protein